MEKSCTVQDVFDRFYPAYEKTHILPAHHRKTAFHIMNLKQGALVSTSVPVENADVSVFIIIHAEAAAVLCVRSFQKKNGSMCKKRMY